jgi:hypothetical protein
MGWFIVKHRDNLTFTLSSSILGLIAMKMSHSLVVTFMSSDLFSG